MSPKARMSIDGGEPIELETFSVELAPNSSNSPAFGPECATFEADFTMSPEDISRLRLMVEPVLSPWVM